MRCLSTVAALVILTFATPVWAAGDGSPMAPSTAVAAAWAREGVQPGPSSTMMNAMLGSYAAMQVLDMASTVRARQAGAREANPLMSGGYGQAMAMKAAMSVGAIGALKLMGKKNRKAAFVTGMLLNVATAAIVAKNMNNTRQLQQR